MLFAAKEYIILSSTMSMHFEHGGHETGSSNILPSTALSRTV